MKKSLLIILLFMIVSCGYNVKTVISKSDQLKDGGKAVVIMRLSRKGMIQPDEYLQNITKWKEGYSSTGSVVFPVITDESLSLYSTDADRFYQVSPDKKYLEYKSIGVIRQYITNNKTGLQNIFAENGSSAIMIYEVDSIYSADLKSMRFSSVLVVINKSFDIAYLDHQIKTFDNAEFNRANIKSELLDNISNRLFYQLEKLNFIKTKD